MAPIATTRYRVKLASLAEALTMDYGINSTFSGIPTFLRAEGCLLITFKIRNTTTDHKQDRPMPRTNMSQSTPIWIKIPACSSSSSPGTTRRRTLPSILIVWAQNWVGRVMHRMRGRRVPVILEWKRYRRFPRIKLTTTESDFKLENWASTMSQFWRMKLTEFIVKFSIKCPRRIRWAQVLILIRKTPRWLIWKSKSLRKSWVEFKVDRPCRSWMLTGTPPCKWSTWYSSSSSNQLNTDSSSKELRISLNSNCRATGRKPESWEAKSPHPTRPSLSDNLLADSRQLPILTIIKCRTQSEIRFGRATRRITKLTITTRAIRPRCFRETGIPSMLMGETHSIIRLCRVTLLAIMDCRPIRILSLIPPRLAPLCSRKGRRSIPLNMTLTNPTVGKETRLWVVKSVQTQFCTRPCKLRICMDLNCLHLLLLRDKFKPPKDPNSYNHHLERVKFHLITWRMLTWKNWQPEGTPLRPWTHSSLSRRSTRLVSRFLNQTWPISAQADVLDHLRSRSTNKARSTNCKTMKIPNKQVPEARVCNLYQRLATQARSPWWSTHTHPRVPTGSPFRMLSWSPTPRWSQP